ncbi:MAG TPA: AAA family ATPase [Candidatus Polarisedimenticolia bacterium]|nr:AAA family ATPase [Candidatus Polarisedimenticolia bacterium]
MAAGERGRIILINGTSSSGKTTLARALQAALPELWLEMGIDRFAYALPGRVDGQLTWPLLFSYVRPDGRSDGPFTIRTTGLGHRFISGMHATAAAIADAGMNVIVDHVILEQRWVEEMARLWASFDVLNVGVRCPLSVVLEREREREDRTLGQAEAQFDVVHRWTTYDVEVDTSVLAPDEAVDRISAALDAMPRRAISGDVRAR